LTIAPDTGDEKTHIRVLLAAEHPLIIAGIRRKIEWLGDIEVVGEAHSGPELIELVERCRPTVALMDLRVPGAMGVQWIERLHESRPGLKIVVLSSCHERTAIDAALLAGATAYVVKSACTIDIAHLLREAASGAVFHAPLPPTTAVRRAAPPLPS
jgi:DNA-binding NarL/FixJ family response regulator